jgi:hypothetical protein
MIRVIGRRTDRVRLRQQERKRVSERESAAEFVTGGASKIKSKSHSLSLPPPPPLSLARAHTQAGRVRLEGQLKDEKASYENLHSEFQVFYIHI